MTITINSAQAGKLAQFAGQWPGPLCLPKLIALEDSYSLNVMLVQAADVSNLRVVTPSNPGA